jgi:hypothetical protein
LRITVLFQDRVQQKGVDGLKNGHGAGGWESVNQEKALQIQGGGQCGLTHFSILRRSSNGTEETIFSAPLNPTGLYNFEHSVDFSDPGSFTLIARAQDSTGRITDSEIAVEIDQPAGKVATPAISTSGGFLRTSRTVTVSCSTAGASIETASVYVGQPAPINGWTPYKGAITVYPDTRIWARATASGLTASDYARADFYRDDSGDDGNPLPPL